MSQLRTPVEKTDHQVGNPEASLVLVEYGDYQCPHCGIAHPFIKKLLKQFKTDLLFVFRNFPLQEMHPEAMPAAQAAEAAAKQNKFWEMHDVIFEHQDRLSTAFFTASAKQLHLDQKQFVTDSNSDDVIDRIERDFDSGVRSGVNGTPSFFLNGQKINSYDETYESLEEAITYSMSQKI